MSREGAIGVAEGYPGSDVMGRIAAESLVERLAECGVDTIFGLSGDVCLATSGPGAIHLLHGLYDAKLDHTPVLAITGTQETSVLGTGYQQEVHLEHLCADLAEYNLIVNSPAQPPGVVDIALRTALARRGVAHLSLPNDIRVADADGPWQHVAPARPATAAGTIATWAARHWTIRGDRLSVLRTEHLHQSCGWASHPTRRSASGVRSWRVG